MNYTAFFSSLWMNLFGTTQLGGLNIGFWFGTAVVALFVVIENIVFWTMKPEQRDEEPAHGEHRH